MVIKRFAAGVERKFRPKLGKKVKIIRGKAKRRRLKIIQEVFVIK